MQRALLFGTVWLICNSFSNAAPAPPIEALLKRAQTVLIARAIATTETSITFRRIELLRGASEAELNLRLIYSDLAFFHIGGEFLLLSQGDARFGPPEPVVGRTLHGQDRWCGWVPLPIVRDANQVYASRIFSFVDGQPSQDGNDPKEPKLSITRIKRLLERFPYDPHINDKA